MPSRVASADAQLPVAAAFAFASIVIEPPLVMLASALPEVALTNWKIAESTEASAEAQPAVAAALAVPWIDIEPALTIET